MKYFVTVNGLLREVEVLERLGQLVIQVDGQPFDLQYSEVDDLGQVIVLHGGKSFALSLEGSENEVTASLAGHRYDVSLEDERERAAHAAEKAAGKAGGVVTAIMPGVVVELLVAQGQAVAKGAPLLILSAMKMQNEIGAPTDGVVQGIHVSAGQAVSAGAKLVTLAPAPGS
ncbi:MAG: biotin/lipoyl-binding protein [Planctomycetes bacterium]|nr:biotin/lipoyl-binding protein [Planctomycetota bacterium]